MSPRGWQFEVPVELAKRGRPKAGTGPLHDPAFNLLTLTQRGVYLQLLLHAQQVGNTFTLTREQVRLMCGTRPQHKLNTIIGVLANQGLIVANSLRGGERGGLISSPSEETYVSSSVEDNDPPCHLKKNGHDAPQQNSLLSGERVRYQDIVDALQQACPSMPRVKKLTDARKRAIKARVREDLRRAKPEYWARMGAYIQNETTMPDWSTPWGLDWILKPANFQKIIEGNYARATS